MRLVMPYTTRNISSDLFSDMDRLFSTFNKPTTAFKNEEKFLAADSEIIEGDDFYAVSVDLPGMKKEDIKIEAHQNTLTISGERKREMTADKEFKVQRSEKFYGQFKRAFTLPELTQADKIEASFQDGVLQVRIPKVAAPQARQIEIK